MLFGTEFDLLLVIPYIMDNIKKLMLQNQLLSQALIFFFMFFLTTFLFSLILKLILPFLIAFLLTKLFYKWIVGEKSHTEMVSFFSSIRKNNGFF
tara:strand:+ start:716 stop:1000 length:285 start_codon:yes stop_codon:yes gene_type:complete